MSSHAFAAHRRHERTVEGDASRRESRLAAGFEKPAPDARAAPPEAHESLIGRKTVEELPLTGLALVADSTGVLSELVA